MALDRTKGVSAVVENTAGQGTNLGYSFDHLKFIIEHVEDKSRVGVCIDTAHGYAAGYDFISAKGYEKTWKEFERIIGFQYLQGMHLNDSKKDYGTRVDRHDSLGKGFLGIQAFENIMKDERIDEIPMILETPNPDIWADEIKMLYEMAG